MEKSICIKIIMGNSGPYQKINKNEKITNEIIEHKSKKKKNIYVYIFKLYCI